MEMQDGFDTAEGVVRVEAEATRGATHIEAEVTREAARVEAEAHVRPCMLRHRYGVLSLSKYFARKRLTMPIDGQSS